MPKTLNSTLARPSADLPTNAPRDAVLLEFGKRVQSLIQKKGWSQSDLARYASNRTKDGSKINRDAVSLYVRGRSYPRPAALVALADVLECEAEYLRPQGVPEANQGVEIRASHDGLAWLRVNQAVPLDVALQVTKLLQGAALNTTELLQGEERV